MHCKDVVSASKKYHKYCGYYQNTAKMFGIDLLRIKMELVKDFLMNEFE